MLGLGVVRLDRSTTKVGEISQKVGVWSYGHVIRREEEHSDGDHRCAGQEKESRSGWTSGTT